MGKINILHSWIIHKLALEFLAFRTVVEPETKGTIMTERSSCWRREKRGNAERGQRTRTEWTLLEQILLAQWCGKEEQIIHTEAGQPKDFLMSFPLCICVLCVCVLFITTYYRTEKYRNVYQRKPSPTHLSPRSVRKFWFFSFCPFAGNYLKSLTSYLHVRATLLSKASNHCSWVWQQGNFMFRQMRVQIPVLPHAN